MFERASQRALFEKILCLGSNTRALLVVQCVFLSLLLRNYSFLYFSFLVGCDHLLGLQMTSESVAYTRFADGASRHTLNLASAAWVIYEPSGQLLSSCSTCLGSLPNNIAEYSAIIELLLAAMSYGIQHMVVHLDSQLAVLQLNGRYRVRDSSILRKYLRIKLLE